MPRRYGVIACTSFPPRAGDDNCHGLASLMIFARPATTHRSAAGVESNGCRRKISPCFCRGLFSTEVIISGMSIGRATVTITVGSNLAACCAI